MPNLNKAYSWAVETCNAPNVGYSQTYRNKKKVDGVTYYDCSSFIWYALKAGDFPVVDAHGGSSYPMTTRDEASVLLNLGFTLVPMTEPWEAGDIAWKTGHTEMVYKPTENGGICMGAHTSNAALENQVSIGSSSGDATAEKTPADWEALYRYGEGGATGYGSSAYVVAAICGNFWQESTLNPGLWEGLTVGTWDELLHGYGLGQWTNTNGDTHGRLWNLHEFLQTAGYPDDSGEGQLAFMIEEGRWLPSDDFGDRFGGLAEFLASDETNIRVLTWAFCNAWEGIHDDSWNARVGYAEQCYDFILEHANDEDITEWRTGNYYLSDVERLNNAVMVYRYLSAGGGGGGTPGKKKRKGNIALWGRPTFFYARRW